MIHLFIKKLKAKCEDKNEKIKCIPQNEENYITFIREVVVDSFVKDGKNVLVKRLAVHRFIQIYGFQFRCIIKEAWQRSMHEYE